MKTIPKKQLGAIAITVGALLILVPLWLKFLGVVSPRRMLIQFALGVFLVAKGVFWVSTPRAPRK